MFLDKINHSLGLEEIIANIVARRQEESFDELNAQVARGNDPVQTSIKSAMVDWASRKVGKIRKSVVVPGNSAIQNPDEIFK